MDTNQRLLELEGKVVSLGYEVMVLKNIVISNQPVWAKGAWEVAESLGIKPSPYGESVDLYRVLELLNRLGLLSQD
ncbi:hypothetical protein [Serratia liquefaciens]|uniref:hypothetical protein n=1 Tax=Serratia liquefaciens TaxID=614 RepID=UPI003B42969A